MAKMMSWEFMFLKKSFKSLLIKKFRISVTQSAGMYMNEW